MPDSAFHLTVDLLRRHHGGDADALDQLYRRYFDRLLAVVRLRMGPKLRSKVESVDIVQDAFVASLRAVDRFTGESEGCFFHWLCKIAENRIRDQAQFFAAQRRDVNLERPLAGPDPSHDSVFGPVYEVARYTTPSRQVVRAEDLRRLESAVDALPEPQREALLMVRFEGLSLREAGERLNRGPDAVRMLVARAIVALTKMFSSGPGASASPEG